MKLQNTIVPLISLSLLSLLGGCAGYKAKPLSRLNTGTPAVQDETITMAYHVLSEEECKTYLDRNVLEKGYQPVHVTLRNNTNKALLFSLDNITVPCVCAHEVAEKVHTSTAGRALGYGVTGAALLPIGLGLTTPWTVPVSIASGAFLIGSVVECAGSAKANKKLDADFNYKELKDQVLKPLEVINGLIFVPRGEFAEADLAVTLFDVETGDPFVVTAHNPRLKLVIQTEAYCPHHGSDSKCVEGILLK